jgi:hypothetical protein
MTIFNQPEVSGNFRFSAGGNFRFSDSDLQILAAETASIFFQMCRFSDSFGIFLLVSSVQMFRNSDFQFFESSPHC